MSSDTPFSPQDETPEALDRFYNQSRPIDLASWLSELPLDQARRHLAAMPLPRQAATFGALSLKDQTALAAVIPAPSLNVIVTLMSAVDRVDLFQCHGPIEQKRLLQTPRSKVCRDIQHWRKSQANTLASSLNAGARAT